LWRAEVAAGGEKIYRLEPASDRGPAAVETDISVTRKSIENGCWKVTAGSGSELVRIEGRGNNSGLFAGDAFELVVFEDVTDTWSHAVPNFGGPIKGKFRVISFFVEEKGPVRAALRVRAGFGNSTLNIWARAAAFSSELELELRLDWHQHLALAKLVLPLPGGISERRDGVPGGAIDRAQDGREYPVIDWTLTRGQINGRYWALGVAAPDCTSLDGSGKQLRFTLCRSPAFAWHDPARLDPRLYYRWTDQGEHSFRFALCGQADDRSLEQRALMYHRPPLCFDWTRGMPQSVD
jgi:alpha-mannosidase